MNEVPDPSLFRPNGGWLQELPPLQPPLEGEVHADVVVVGAGFAGLCTALELSARGAKVVVLEQAHAGFGASGRNAGYLVGGQGLEYDLFLKRVGQEQAKKIVGFYDEGVAYVERQIATHAIDCDYNPSGVIRAGVHRSQEKKLRRGMQTGIDLGSPAQFLDGAAMRARGIPPAFLFGCHLPSGGTLDPGKYVTGLRGAALRAGVRLHENTPVRSWTDGKTLRFVTDQGSASAPFGVLATNAYTPQLGLLRNRVAPMRVSAIETGPLTAAQLAALGWPRREGVVTVHWTMESHRLTARNTLVLTTKRLDYVYGSKTPNVPDAVAYRALAATLRERFPELGSIAIRACWSGYVSLAYDALPVIGESGERQNILHTAGCSGHGLGTQSLVGQLIAERIFGREHPLLAALRHKTPPTLPEPLQWCAIKSALGLTNLLDGQLNRRARRQPAQA